MSDMKIKIKLDDGSFLPEQAHETDAGYDIRTPVDVIVPCYTGGAVVDTGVHIAIPAGYYGRLAAKSGLNVKHDIVGEGVIDSGYTGSIRVKLYNHGAHSYPLKRGDKIIQLIIERCHTAEFEVVDDLDATERGDGGFGSTGR